jgi:CubicO group peptidase (beta-lactamase class C family)
MPRTLGAIVLWTILVCAAVFIQAYWFGEPPVVRGDVRSIENHLVETLSDAVRERRLGTYALALVHGGKIVAQHGDRRLFLVASVSKCVTAWGVMKLVQEGKIALDEPVARHLKRWQFPGEPQYRDRVTVRQLLSHTAGLDWEMRIVREPGTVMDYSNASTNVLQLLIEDVTGQPFATYMRDSVLRPLGMNDASFDWEEASKRIAPAFDENSAQQEPRKPESVAAAGLHSTAEDLARFAIAFTGNPVLSKDTLQLMLQPQPATGGSWGLGHTLYTKDVAGHDGGAYPAWGAMLRVNPTTGNAMVLLSSGGRGAVNQSGHDWVWWETGEMTDMARRQIVYSRSRPALIAILAGTLVIVAWRLRAKGAR